MSEKDDVTWDKIKGLDLLVNTNSGIDFNVSYVTGNSKHSFEVKSDIVELVTHT